MDYSTVLIAFGLTLFAGLSTGIGSALAFLTKETNTKFLSLALGFSAGVMIYVSFAEILVKGKNALSLEWGELTGSWAAVGAFFSGMLLIGIIDKLVPNEDNPHEPRYIEELDQGVPVQNMDMSSGHHPHNTVHTPRCFACAQPDASLAPAAPRELKNQSAGIQPAVPPKVKKDLSKLHRMGIFTALAIAIHNFPEGLATFTAALTDPTLGVAIAVAIAIHNIPEGIAVSVPIYYATGSRKKAFLYSFLSGLAEPVGALVGYLLLFLFVPADKVGIIFGILFSAVAGIMVFISLDELLPAAQEYGEHHLCTYGAVGGMGVMAVSLLLFM